MIFKKSIYEDAVDLVVACQKQDRRAQRIFFDRYKDKMIGVCQRYARTLSEGEDIFQEAFIKVFMNIDDLRKPELADRWVKKTVIRTAINYYNRTTIREKLLTPIESLGQYPNSSDYRELFGQMDLNIVLKIINELPNGYRSIINLHVIDGYTHVEISHLLNIGESTSKSQFSRGRKLLIKKLYQQGIIEHSHWVGERG